MSGTSHARSEDVSSLGKNSDDEALQKIINKFRKSIPRRALQKIRKAFEMRYLGQNKEESETWLRKIIVLIPKKKIINKLEGHT